MRPLHESMPDRVVSCARRQSGSTATACRSSGSEALARPPQSSERSSRSSEDGTGGTGAGATGRRLHAPGDDRRRLGPGFPRSGDRLGPCLPGIERAVHDLPLYPAPARRHGDLPVRPAPLRAPASVGPHDGARRDAPHWRGSSRSSTIKLLALRRAIRGLALASTPMPRNSFANASLKVCSSERLSRI